MLQVLVEVTHEDVPRLLLNLIGLIGAVLLGVDEHLAVHGMIELFPHHVLARFLLPFIPSQTLWRPCDGSSSRSCDNICATQASSATIDNLGQESSAFSKNDCAEGPEET
jgi:hypothetical protein